MFRPVLGHLQAVDVEVLQKSKVLRLPAGIPSVTFTFGYKTGYDICLTLGC
jgi:hypothetical protein